MSKIKQPPRELTEQLNKERHEQFLAEQAAWNGRAPPVVKPSYTIIDGVKAYDAPGQSKLSAMERLHRANCGTTKNLPSDDFVMTDAERGGLSIEAFGKLRPEVRLTMYNKAKHAREPAAK